MITSILIIAAVGFIVSLYSFFIEQKLKYNPAYKPICDISDRVSCTKPFTSPYGNVFFLSNAVIGIFFYAFIMTLAWCEYATLIFYCSLAAVITSVYLAYILYTKIKSLCLLCAVIYAVNLALLVVSYVYV